MATEKFHVVSAWEAQNPHGSTRYLGLELKPKSTAKPMPTGPEKSLKTKRNNVVQSVAAE